jgi:hypothetical protein
VADVRFRGVFGVLRRPLGADATSAAELAPRSSQLLFSDQIHIDPAYREALRACGLLRVEDILARVDGRVAAWSRSTDTMHLPGLPGQPGFYLKRYYYPSLKKRIRGTFRGTFFGLHRGQAEYRALQTMRGLGISAVRPVACGARRVGHFVAACFLITEEVPGARNLTSFAGDVSAGRELLTRRQRLAMAEVLARQVAEMHAAGFSHGQLFWRNIVVRAGLAGTHEFFFLDAQPQPAWRRLGHNADFWQQELAHLAVSATPFTTRTERLRFLLRYFGAARLSASIKAQAGTIAELSCKWQRHEAQRIKMNDLFNEWNRQLEREPSSAAPVSSAAQTAPALRQGARR